MVDTMWIPHSLKRQIIWGSHEMGGQDSFAMDYDKGRIYLYHYAEMKI